MPDFNFVPYAGGSTQLREEIRISGNYLVIGLRTMEKLGRASHVRILADKIQQVIRLEGVEPNHLEGRTPHPVRSRGGEPTSWRIVSARLTANFPSGRYQPMPDEELTFKYEGGPHA